MTPKLEYAGSHYRLLCAPDRPYVYLYTGDDKPLLELFVPSSVHSTTGADDTTALSSWRVEHENDYSTFILTAQSSLWQSKTYRVVCSKERLRFEIEVEGEGKLTDVQYFGGYYSGQVRWGSGFFWSGQRFERGFNPEPTVEEAYEFAPSSGSLIDLTGVPIAGKAGWFFTPPPYLFAFEGGGTWLGMGLETPEGENRYTDFHYRGQRGAFYLSLAYEGHTQVRGRYTLPALGLEFGSGPYDVLERHVTTLRQRSLVPQIQPQTRPDWWYSPIYCGWGSQCYLASQGGGRAPEYARQEHYEGFMERLEAHDIAPGVVVLDDKWQKHYGTNEVDLDKWPDLHGFIARQHRAGRRVFLWLKAWDAEGLEASECITNAAGLPLAFDPTNPTFEARLREQVRTMLSRDGYDADGFKLDFTARIPSGPGLRRYGDAWGLELMKRHLSILYSEAKAVKHDALIMTHTPHPYLTDTLDMIRLNDINTGKDVNSAMQHRARVAKIACPEAIIDTDNWPITDKNAWREYVRLQPELGVPSLYYATHIDATGEALQEDDYALIREAWRAHQAKREAR